MLVLKLLLIISGERMSNNGDDAEAAAVDIAVDRICIGCDNCGVGSPQKCCARCGCFYYCRYVKLYGAYYPHVLNMLFFMRWG